MAQAMERRERPHIPRVPMITGSRYKKRIMSDMISNNGVCSVSSSESFGKRSSNEKSMPANHESIKRPTSKTMSPTMKPSRMRC